MTASSGLHRGADILFRFDPGLTGKRNMEIDTEWLEGAEAASEPITLVRFYRWRGWTISLGRNQRAAQAADLEFCSRRGIDIVRRPTGGAAVLHGSDLTYAVISNQMDRFGNSLSATYLRIGQCLQEGLRRHGIETSLMRPSVPRRSRTIEPCFVRAGRAELLVDDKRKLVGSAQRRLRRSFLQHGSIPLTIDHELMAGALNCSPELLRETVTCVSEQRPGDLTFEDLAAALQTGFEVELGRQASCL